MIYVISGDGVIAPDELTDTLGTLWDDHSDKNEPFTVVVPFDGDDRPDWVDGVLDWLREEDALFYIVAPSSLDSIEISSKRVRDAAEDVILARRLPDRLFSFSDKLAEDKGEDLALLLVNNSEAAVTDADEALISRFLDQEIPAKFIPGLADIGEIVDAPEEPEDEPEPDPEPAPRSRGSRRQRAEEKAAAEDEDDAPEEKSVSQALQAPDGTYAEEDLQLLTRNEVRDIGKGLGVTPRDWRSKDAIIEAILEYQGGAPAPSKAADEDGPAAAPEKPSKRSKGADEPETGKLPGRVVVGALAFVLYSDGTTEQVGLDAAEASRLVDPF